MVLIHIRSLPSDPPLDVPAILRRMNCEIAEQLGVPAQFVSMTWETLAPGHYAVGGRTLETQSPTSHPVIVEIRLPSFTHPDSVRSLMDWLARGLAERTRVPIDNINVCVLRTTSGEVLEGGRIACW